MKRTVFFALLAAASVTGCTGDFASATLGHQNTLCAPPQGTQIVLAYPAPGSTGIPDNFGEVIFAGSPSGLPGNYRAYLIDESSGEVTQVNFVSVVDLLPPIPQPAATPPFTTAYYSSSANPGVTFPKGHRISVHLQQVKCNTSDSYGTFTVQ